MSDKDRSKPLPRLSTDEEAARFVNEADLTDYDLAQFTPGQFELEKKSARINMRLPETLLNAVKAKAQVRGIPYQRFIREAIERAVADRNR